METTMNKLLILPFLALSGIAPAVLPAQAADTSSVPYCTGGESIADDADMIALKLQGNGVKAGGVEEWNGCVRAYITDANGHEAMAYFDPVTLQRVG
jgi:hypothetical protein